MKNNQVVKVKIEGIEEVEAFMKKVRRLNCLLNKANSLVDELASKKINIIFRM